MIKLNKREAASTFLMAASCLPPAIPAVYAESSLVLEEVMVTARRRTESLQDAPLAVSAFSGDDLMDAGVTNLADITEMVPNLQISRPSRDANIYIRGVGPARGATNVTELSVGVYIDDVFILKPHGQLMDLAEIQSVQVLRGPQGTLFGKNTTGGALVVTTVKPQEELGGYIQATVGNDNRLNLQGSIDVPLGDSFLTKLTLTSVEADGYGQDPVHGTELSDENRQGALLQARWLASDRFTADFSYFYNKIDENLLAMGDCVVTNRDAAIPGAGLITPATGLDLMPDFCERASDGIATYYDPDRKFELEAHMASVNLSWDINDDHTLRSITAWRTQETPNINYTNTYAGFPSGQRSLEDGESTQVSQEFQLSGDFAEGSLRYTLGVYYMEDESDTGLSSTWNGVDGIWASSIADGLPPGLVAALTNYNEQGQDAKNSTLAVFTQWSWDITDNFELTAGVRYGSEERELETQRTDAALPWDAYADVPGAIIIPGSVVLMTSDTFFNEAESALPLALGDTTRLETDKTFDSTTPMVSAAYSIPQEALSDSLNGLMMYASYTVGYKAGGFSDFNVGELVPFEEEEIDSIEIGFKLDAFDNRLRLNAAFFSMEYDEMQLFVARPDPDPNSIGTLQGVTNAGASKIKGAELELAIIPADGWLINITGSYADGKFDEFDDFVIDPETGEPVILDRSDEALPSLPETSFSLGIQYDWQTGMGDWSVRADAFYRDEIYWGFDAATWDNPLAREASTTDSFTVFNARVNWQVNDSFSIAAWGKNLADEEYTDGGVGETANLGHVVKGMAPPRRYGVDVRFDF